MIRTLTILTAALVLSVGLSASSMVWDATGNNQFGTLNLSTGTFSEMSNFGFTPAGLGEIGDALYTGAGANALLGEPNQRSAARDWQFVERCPITFSAPRRRAFTW